jgi:hypothetical protein
VLDGRYPRWLWTLVAIPPLVAILTSLLAPEPHGHWSEHLAAAGLKGAQLVLLLVLVTMLGWRTLGVLLLIAFAVVAVGMALQAIGDYQVVDSIWRTSGDPGSGTGYAEGHARSEFGDLLVIVGGLAFAVIAGVTLRVPVLLAVVAAVMVVIPPPFLWPAAGVLVLVLYGLTSASRFDRARSGSPREASVLPTET